MHVEYSRQDQWFLNMFLIAFMLVIALIAYILMSFYKQDTDTVDEAFLRLVFKIMPKACFRIGQDKNEKRLKTNCFRRTKSRISRTNENFRTELGFFPSVFLT